MKLEGNSYSNFCWMSQQNYEIVLIDRSSLDRMIEEELSRRKSITSGSEKQEQVHWQQSLNLLDFKTINRPNLRVNDKTSFLKTSSVLCNEYQTMNQIKSFEQVFVLQEPKAGVASASAAGGSDGSPAPVQSNQHQTELTPSRSGLEIMMH